MCSGVYLKGGLDIRGNKGYAMVPPSMHDDTDNLYEWVVLPDECPLADAPAWLLDLIKKVSSSGGLKKKKKKPIRVKKTDKSDEN